MSTQNVDIKQIAKLPSNKKLEEHRTGSENGVSSV